VSAVNAIVMAGGKGTRLYPYTAVLPKPLMPVGDAPVLELLLRQLSAHGVRHVYLAVNHLRHLIQAFFGNGSALGLNIEYAVEDTPLGTCGPVAGVLDHMDDDFLLLNGDLVTDLDFSAMRARHLAQGADATVAGLWRKVQVEFGVLDTDASGRLIGVREKPVTEYLMSMGVYMLRRDAIRPFLTPGAPLNMPDLLTAMVGAGAHVDCHVTSCEWLDIGRPDDYALAQKKVADGIGNLLPASR
jgi:NDP-sugar pyrophosphorylase family protein